MVSAEEYETKALACLDDAADPTTSSERIPMLVARAQVYATLALASNTEDLLVETRILNERH